MPEADAMSHRSQPINVQDPVSLALALQGLGSSLSEIQRTSSAEARATGDAINGLSARMEQIQRALEPMAVLANDVQHSRSSLDKVEHRLGTTEVSVASLDRKMNRITGGGIVVSAFLAIGAGVLVYAYQGDQKAILAKVDQAEQRVRDADQKIDRQDDRLDKLEIWAAGTADRPFLR